MKKWKDKSISFGMDPELFILDRNKKVVIAQKYFPDELEAKSKGEKLYYDGLLLELNPIPDTCRKIVIGNIWKCLTTAYSKVPKSVKILSIPGQHIPLKVIQSAHPQARIFGCHPDYDIYTDTVHRITVNAEKYTFRSGGGHVHLGVHSKTLKPFLKDDIENTVKILDIILGNTMVLLDRHVHAKKRRECYGIAGSYRRPEHGLEYRVLSNAFLIHPALVSFVLGLTRLAPNIIYNKLDGEFFSAVSEEKIIRAINNNDFALAKRNYHAIRPILLKYKMIDKDSLIAFEYIAKVGIDKIFGFDLKRNWSLSNSDGICVGFNHFIKNILHNDNKFITFQKKFDPDEDNIGRQPKMFDFWPEK